MPQPSTVESFVQRVEAGLTAGAMVHHHTAHAGHATLRENAGPPHLGKAPRATPAAAAAAAAAGAA